MDRFLLVALVICCVVAGIAALFAIIMGAMILMRLLSTG